jgi:hypothetical protein
MRRHGFCIGAVAGKADTTTCRQIHVLIHHTPMCDGMPRKLLCIRRVPALIGNHRALCRKLKTERRLLDARSLPIISTRDRNRIQGITGSLHAKCDLRPISRPFLPLGLALMMFCSPSFFLVFRVRADRLASIHRSTRRNSCGMDQLGEDRNLHPNRSVGYW